jgi:hypothetical protein
MRRWPPVSEPGRHGPEETTARCNSAQHSHCLLGIMHGPLASKTYHVSETGSCFRLQVEPTQLSANYRNQPAANPRSRFGMCQYITSVYLKPHVTTAHSHCLPDIRPQGAATNINSNQSCKVLTSRAQFAGHRVPTRSQLVSRHNSRGPCQSSPTTLAWPEQVARPSAGRPGS